MSSNDVDEKRTFDFVELWHDIAIQFALPLNKIWLSNIEFLPNMRTYWALCKQRHRAKKNQQLHYTKDNEMDGEKIHDHRFPT